MHTYLVSFGNSTEYLTKVPDGPVLADLKKHIKTYLETKFPEMQGLDYYDKMTVVPIAPEDIEKYYGYKIFSADSVDEIKHVLSTEVRAEQGIKELNNNAEFSDISTTPRI